jgi:prepilin-type N-terminal cleavage/methylation domain-containing protein
MLRGSRNGFTLVELILALSLTGFAMLGGVMLLDQLGDSTNRITREGARVARDGNGERLLGRLLLDATVSTDTTNKFLGNEHSVVFSTTCEVPGGWTEPCRATLAIDTRDDSSAVLAELSTGESHSLRRQPGAAELRYFDPSTGRDTVWVRQWSSNVTLPGAVALVLRGDTAIYPVSGAR